MQAATTSRFDANSLPRYDSAVAAGASDGWAARGTADSSQNESTAISESKAMVVLENANGVAGGEAPTTPSLNNPSGGMGWGRGARAVV